jgi:ankyrin repeat protein
MAHYEKVIQAAVDGRWGEAEALIIKYEEPPENYCDSYHGTILHIAVRRYELDVVQKIIASGFDVNTRDSRDRTALHVAVERLSRSDAKTDAIFYIVSTLVSAGIDKDAVSRVSGSSALHTLVAEYRINHSGSRYRIVQFLLKVGANVNVFNTDPMGRQYGMTPYMVATMQGCSSDLLDLLRKYGANFNHVRDTYGYQHLTPDAKPDNLFSDN